MTKSETDKQKLERQHEKPLGEKAPPPKETDFREQIRTRPASGAYAR